MTNRIFLLIIAMIFVLAIQGVAAILERIPSKTICANQVKVALATSNMVAK